MAGCPRTVEEFSVDAVWEFACQTELKKTEKKSKSDKIFLFLPNPLLKVITLPTHFLVKTMAKTLGMVAHMIIEDQNQPRHILKNSNYQYI